MNIDYIKQFYNLTEDINLDIIHEKDKYIVQTPNLKGNPILDNYVTRIIDSSTEQFKSFLDNDVYHNVPMYTLMQADDELLSQKYNEIEEWWKYNHPDKLKEFQKNAFEEGFNKMIYFQCNIISDKDYSYKECWSTYITPKGVIYTAIEYKPSSFNDRIISNMLDIN